MSGHSCTLAHTGEAGLLLAFTDRAVEATVDFCAWSHLCSRLLSLNHPGDWAILCTHLHARTHAHVYFCGAPPILPMCAFPIPGRNFSWEAGGNMSAGLRHCSHGKDADITGPASHPALTPGAEGCSAVRLLCHLQPPAILWAHVWSPLPATILAVWACTVC